MHRLVYIYVFPCFVSGQNLETKTPQQQWSHLPPRSSFIIPLFNERNQGFLEKWPILRLEKGIHTMSLDHLLSPKNKDIKSKQKKVHLQVEACQEEMGVSIKTGQWPNLKKNRKKNN